MKSGDRVYMRDVKNPLHNKTLYFRRSEPSREHPGRVIAVILVYEWGREISVWQEDIYRAN